MRRRGNISRRCMAAIISAVMLMSTGAVAFPMGVYADTYYLENGSVTVEAKDDGSQYVTQADNNINSVEDADPVISTDDPNEEKNTVAADGSTTNTLTINAEAGQTANVTLEDVNIDVSATENAKAVDTTGAGDVTIKLDGTNQVKSGEKAAGIQKENTGTLTITDTPGTNDDSLNATGGALAAGIGGGYEEEGSNITITGDTIVTATGEEAAGIGGGFNGEGSYITIEGNATVTATGGDTAAAIGGGHNKDGTNITIKDSATVTATGGDLGAGIGGGGDGKGTYITIADNATVTATGGTNGAGIGGGNHKDGTNITIADNATVTATGGECGAGIGGGKDRAGSNITIVDNATVTATGGEAAAGIGGGSNGTGTVTISGGEVTATGGTNGAGIGGGSNGTGTVTISGGEVTATGGTNGAGIGGGSNGTGTVTISGGEVTATGGTNGAGIGGGDQKESIRIIIGGNATVTATGGALGAGIGGGNNGVGYGSGVYIEDNATVTATGGDSAAGIGGGYNGKISSLGIAGNSIVIATGGNSAIDIDNSYVCGGTGIGGSSFNGTAPDINILDSPEVYVSSGKSADGYPEAPAIGIAPHYETDSNQNTVLVSGTEIPEATLFQFGFNGTLTRYEPGTTTAQIRNIVFPNSQPVTDPSGNNTSDTKTSVQSDDTNNTENNDTDSNYTDNASSYQGITPAMLTRLINGLMGTYKAGVITIDFGRNICLTPEIMKILAETGNSAKNCSFIYKNKKYNLYIPIIDKNSNAYKDAMEVLKKEDNNRGFAGFMRVYEIYRDLGVTLQEIK